MSQSTVEEISYKAIRISELIEEVLKLNNLLELHRNYNAGALETQQYLDRRSDFMKELNVLLNPYRLKLVGVEQAA